eukprot:TRINITY_DN1574_c0_g1_i3.p1 TRINITY_DN1574_c0_g1~~TRINITY_DN1574_c0_g1_i3.p1  ORF type:complete len:241 (+),score=24.98 TRINITY_DN1574_c0_g1_i3:5-727(+)
MDNTISLPVKREDRQKPISPVSLIDELQSNMKLVEQTMTKPTHITHPNPRPQEKSQCSPLLAKRDYPTLAQIVDDQARGLPMSEEAQGDLVAKKLKVAAQPSSSSLALRREPCSGRVLARLQEPRAKRVWSVEERKKFFNGLRLFGTDFSMIQALILPHRSQKEIYKRFRREDKINSGLVTRSLHWNSNHKVKISAGFSRVLKELRVDLKSFDPLEPPKPKVREDGIKPLEYYLLNPSFN